MTASTRSSPRPPRPACALGLLVALAVGCAGSIRPVADTDLVGGGPSATRVTVRVIEALEVPAPFSFVYVLPVGEYRPAYADRHGVYFASPTGVIQRSNGTDRVFPGGIHLPNAGGHYYSFPSLYVEFSKGDPMTLALPDEIRARYGENVVFTVDGVEQRP